MTDDGERCPYCESTDIVCLIGHCWCFDCGKEWSVKLADTEDTLPTKSDQDIDQEE